MNLKKIILFIYSLFVLNLNAKSCEQYLDTLELSLSFASKVKNNNYLKIQKELFSRTILATEFKEESSLSKDLKSLFLGHPNFYEYINALYSNNFSSAEILNVLSYAARLKTGGNVRDLTVFMKLQDEIGKMNINYIKEIIIKYNMFQTLLERTKKTQLYKIFGKGKYYSEGTDTSTLYLDLLAREVLYKFYESIKDNKKRNYLNQSLDKLGELIRENILEKNILVGHDSSAIRENAVGKRRTIVDATSYSFVEKKYKNYFESYAANSKHLLIISKKEDGTTDNTCRQKGKMLNFDKLNNDNKYMYERLQWLYSYYIKEPYDFVYIAPVTKGGTILTCNVKLQKGQKVEYVIIHTTPERTNRILNSHTLKTLYNKLLTYEYKIKKQRFKNNFTQDIATLYWYLINAMPYYRGSGSLLDVLVKSIYLKQGFDLPIFPKRLDYIAFSSSLENFVKQYKTLDIKYMSKKDFESKIFEKKTFNLENL